MPIKHAVGPGTILRCDYSRGGFQPPEMVKPRAAIVVSPRLPHRDGFCTVVPISASENRYDVDYVVRLEIDPPLPEPYSFKVCFAKCDMLATVAFERLDLFRTERDRDGKRKYLHPKLKAEDFQRVMEGVKRSLSFRNLTFTGE